MRKFDHPAILIQLGLGPAQLPIAGNNRHVEIVLQPMPTVLGHAMVGIGLGAFAVSRERTVSQNVSTVASLSILSAVPDLDTLAFAFGIPYSPAIGHRGFFHSAVFAMMLGTFFFGVAYLDRQRYRRMGATGNPEGKMHAALLLVYLLVSISHPLLDMLTDGGLGIALLAPFANERLFFPLQPIPVSPIGVSASVLPVLKWELMVFGPIVVVGWAAAVLMRRRCRIPGEHSHRQTMPECEIRGAPIPWTIIAIQRRLRRYFLNSEK